MSLKVEIIPVTPFQQNCSLLWCSETSRVAIVDPGGDLDRIVAQIEKHKLIPEKILITHGHVDHAAGAAELAEKLSIPIEGPHQDDLFLIEKLAEQSQNYGFLGQARSFVPARWLGDGDQVRFGNITLDVIHCPGHTPGHVVYFCEAERLALVGDVLFAGSVGRTDFPRSDSDALINSIRNKLWPLGEDVEFISGHGPMSSFGRERRTNPYCGDQV